MNDKPAGSEKKIIAGILGILLGGFGVHRFYLGDVSGGLIRFGISVITCGIGGVIGLVEGILYLVKSDEDFVEEYINQKKKWF